MSFPRYETYKESGVEWLGEVPEHWGVGALARITDRVVVGIAEAATHAYSDEGVAILRSTNIRAGKIIGELLYIKEEFADGLDSKRLHAGDLVTVRTGNAGVTTVVPKDLDNCQCFTLLITTLNHRGDSEFFCYYINSFSAQSYFSLEGWGTAQVNISVPILKMLSVPIPPIEEQAQIARFLDYETTRIDALIAEQEWLIELLKEKRQAVISHAVTKGLDLTVPMRDSGVEWIGDVPEHWRTLKLTRVLQSVEQGWSPNASNQSAEMGEWGVIKISAIKKGIFVEYENKALLENTAPEISLEIRNGDLLVTRANTPDLVGDACVVQKSPDAHLMLSDLVYRLRLEKNIDARFICFFLISDYGRAQIKGDARGSSMSMAKISQGHIKGWSVGLPDYSEQVKIADYIDSNTSKLNELIDQAYEGIELLQERRSALISAAVTGKIDVRDWKAPASASPSVP